MNGKQTPSRHKITYDYVKDAGMLKVRAVCSCEWFASPLYFGFERAQDQGHDHMFAVHKTGRIPHT